MRDTFIKELCKQANSDPRIMLVTGDLGFGVFNEYREKYPEQFLNAGVAEQNMTGIATGLALERRIVFTYSIANFPTLRCLEQVRNDACYHSADVKIVSIGAGFSYGSLGISHHATEDLAIMRSLPDITVVSPCGLWETEQATKAIIDTPGTCYFRLDKSFGDDSPFEGEQFELGRVRLLRQGEDVVIFVTGGILEEVLDAVKVLAAEGISVAVVSVHTLKPFDSEIVLQLSRKISRVVTVEEHTLHGGLGGIIAEVLMDNCVALKTFLRIGLESGFSSIVGDQKYLRKCYGLDADSIVQRIKASLC